MTKKENYLKALRGEKPEWVPNYSTDSQSFMPSAFQDPYSQLYEMYFEALEKGEQPGLLKVKDGFGVSWVMDDVGVITEPGNLLLDDVEEWKEKFTIPDLSGYDWDGRIAEESAYLDPDKALEMIVIGPFMQMVNAMGFENALVALACQEEETKEFLDAVISFLEECITNTLKRMKYDCVQIFEDFANSRTMFMSPEMFRDVLLPYEKRLIDCAKAADLDVIIQLHTCGKCEEVLRDWVELGVQAWQPAQPVNDLKKIQETFGNKLTLVGAWDNVTACADDNATEDSIRQSIRDSFDNYGKNGAYVFWEGGQIGTASRNVERLEWAMDEAENYGHKLYQKMAVSSDL